ncbi:hypothetical protein [Ructibacterium gallinarum]|uniref:Uncharacterized protein n=1 Tax=Ructibacterium gallinarum TaxID=2779355 RepID=A0A9D5R7U9_9FIRM|nr:hypothetical protein [Ructibacterium gallinarum]MBE5039235.1 hypothetical protein [Ructibacterium gallinarum]
MQRFNKKITKEKNNFKRERTIMKKLFAMGLAIIMAVSSLCCISAFAAEEIPNLNNSLTRGSNIPDTDNVLYLPGNTDSFTYQLNSNIYQYSDFVISTTQNNTGIGCRYTATDNSHILTIELLRRNDNVVVGTKRVTASVGVTKEFKFDFYDYNIIPLLGYYLRLSSSNNGSGTITVY